MVKSYAQPVKDQAIEMRAREGLSYDKIAARLKVHKNTVIKWIRANDNEKSAKARYRCLKQEGEAKALKLSAKAAERLGKLQAKRLEQARKLIERLAEVLEV